MLSKQNKLPVSVLHSLTGQIVTLVDLCSNSNYKHCLLIKKIIPDAAPIYYEEYKSNKLLKRYDKFPLAFFWFLQHCRKILNKYKNY